MVLTWLFLIVQESNLRFIENNFFCTLHNSKIYIFDNERIEYKLLILQSCNFFSFCDCDKHIKQKSSIRVTTCVFDNQLIYIFCVLYFLFIENC